MSAHKPTAEEIELLRAETALNTTQRNALIALLDAYEAQPAPAAESAALLALCDETDALVKYLDTALAPQTRERLAAAAPDLARALRAVLAKLEHAEREREDAERGLNRRVQRMAELLHECDEARAERDAALKRASDLRDAHGIEVPDDE